MMGFWRLRKRGRTETPPGGIDCAAVMQRLYEYLDEELDEEMIGRIRQHLEICKRCYPQYAFEKAFLRFISEQGRVEAPPELRRRVFQSILEEES